MEIRNKYQEFIYESFKIDEINDELVIEYLFKLDDKHVFKPRIIINKDIILNENINKEMLDYLVFNIGMVELVSYYKCALPYNIVINAGYVSEEQIAWFKKLYFHGLGEFFYVNKIDVDSDFVNIKCNVDESVVRDLDYKGSGNLIPVGGGKDSVVTMELLKGLDNNVFMINPKEAMTLCSELGGYKNPVVVKRIIDKHLIELNNEGYLNGHTPFSAIVAFVSYLVSYLNNKKYIVLSNEASANEANVEGTMINHQYSKSFEFEKDFNDYVEEYFNLDITYFSLLRPLQEIQIAKLFSKYTKYHQVFKSCNVGSKSNPWKWCLNCPKCLFVYIMLSPFISRDELIQIFGEDLYEREDLLDTFIELIGESVHKPFECVGTYNEVKYAISQCINSYGELPYLLKYYQNNYELYLDDIMNYYNEDNYLNEEFDKIVRGAL